MTDSKNPLAQFKPRKTDMGLANSASYVKPIKLCADLTGEVQDGKAKKGDFFYGKTRNLGREVLIVPLEARDHALQLDGVTVVDESFDRTSDVFGKIKALRQKYVQGASYGYDYLCWLPGEGDFAVDYLSKTSLDTAPDFERHLGRLCVLSSYEKPQKKNPKVKYGIQKLDLAEPQEFRMPTEEQVAAAVAIFRNPRQRNPGAQDEGADEGAAPKAGGKASRKGA